VPFPAWTQKHAGDAYRSQIDEFMASAKLTAELDVVFDIDPAFHAAMA
jgi:hypothetical protein